MVIAQSVKQTFPYICQAERGLPKQQQTVFHLRRLPATVAMALDNLHEASADGKHVTLRMGDQRKVTLLAGIAGWDNLVDEGGAPVEFRSHKGVRVVCGITITNAADADLVDMLPQDVAEEISDAIKTGSAFTAADAKN